MRNKSIWIGGIVGGVIGGVVGLILSIIVKKMRSNNFFNFKGKKFHVFNTTVFFMIAIFFGYLFIREIIEFFTYLHQESSYYIMPIPLALLVFFFIIFVIYIKSFHSCKLNNNWFLISSILNILILFGLATFLSLFFYDVRIHGGSDAAMGGFIFFILFFGLIFFLSIILFLIGYIKNKKVGERC